MRRYIGIHLLIPTIFYHVCLTSAALEYYGRYIGPLKSYHHGVTGDVYAVDARTFHIRDFTYDGEGPAAYFYVGNTKSVNANGFRVLDEKGSPNALKRYRRKHITLTLPEGRTLNNIKWFSVWCDEAAISFADIKVPKNLDFPKPQKISPLSGVHAVSSDPIVVVDAQTLLIPSFSYDGEAPDAKFWVGRGTKPSPQGIRVPDENGKELPLRRYDRKTIVLTLPGDLTIFDIGHFGVWCEAFTVDFGHIQIPRGLNVPPSLKMLGVSPQKRSRSLHLSALQQSQQLLQQGNNKEQHDTTNSNISYQNVLPLFVQQQTIRATTYKPANGAYHRFSHKSTAAPSDVYNTPAYVASTSVAPTPTATAAAAVLDTSLVQIVPSISFSTEHSNNFLGQFRTAPPPPHQPYFIDPHQQFLGNQQRQLFFLNDATQNALKLQQQYFQQQQQQQPTNNNFKTQQYYPQQLVNNNKLVSPQNVFPLAAQRVYQQPAYVQQPSVTLLHNQLLNGHQGGPVPHATTAQSSFSRFVLNSGSGTHDSFVQY